VYNEDKEVTMSFFYSKKNDVYKRMPVYNPAEIEIQAAAFVPFVQEMAKSDNGDINDRTLYLNTIQDVRDQLLTIGDKGKLKFKENSQADQLAHKYVRIELSYAENLLGIFTIVPMQNEGGQHILRVSFTLSKNLAAETGSVDIPVITHDDDMVNFELKEVLTKLQLKNHVNCNEDNISQMVKFSPAFGKLVTFMVEKGSSAEVQKFTLKSADDFALGTITYKKPAENTQEVGRYHLVVTMNGEEVRDVTFDRMTVPEFNEFLRKLDLGALFHSLWQKIQAIYKEDFDSLHQGVDVAFQNSETHKTFGFIGSEKSFLSTFVDKKPYNTLQFKEESKEVNLHLTTNIPSMAELSLTFARREFRREVVSAFFRNSLAMMDSQKGGLGVRVSQVKRLLA